MQKAVSRFANLKERGRLPHSYKITSTSSLIDDTLQLRETANTTLEGANYEFKVCDTATELKERIYQRNRPNNRARRVAGNCWDWVSQKTKSNPLPKSFAN